jgi:acyl-coenzyme A synthetase/AMP-(fatty) acid ligase
LDSSAVSHLAESPPPAGFDWLLRSPLELPPLERWRFATLGAMLETDDAEQDRRPLLIGADRTGPLDITLADLRQAARRADEWRRRHAFAPSDSLLLVRLPHTSEAPLAAAVVALMSLGLRVVLPMSFDRTTLADMARASGCRAMLWCAAEAATTSHAQVRRADVMYRAVADEVGMPTFSLDGELDWHLPVAASLPEATNITERADVAEREVLVLSTSGSTGPPKLVRYTERALLGVAEAWNVAGLMSEALTGGPSICPALSHSMGMRNVLHAIWNRQPTLLAQAEWLEERPKQFVQLMERCAPRHITCGPALLGDLSLLSASVRRVREALSSLRCVVSSGAADLDIDRTLPAGVRVANAFGMTEVQQVLNTLLGPPAAVRGSLGGPLPGVSVAVRYVDAARRIGRLFVHAPFAARGYVAAPDFGPWFETGDLVRIDGDNLVWVGRVDEDFLNSGLGVKVSLADLRGAYRQLQREADAVFFVASSRRGGVAAVAYVGERDPAAPEVHSRLREAVAADHQQMADQQRDFALNYMSLSVVGCVAGRPPRRGPGKIDRERALSELSELLAAMDNPASDHPRILNIPQHGSDRLDWRRYASGHS